MTHEHHDHSDHGHRHDSIDLCPPDHHDDSVALHVHELHVAFEQGNVLDNICIQVKPGSSLALLGPNGAGKTTLLRAALGLVPVSSGVVEVFGRPAASARDLVAYVPQAEALDREFPVSALQVVTMGRYRSIGFARRPSRNDRRIAAAALDRVGLADRASARFGVLSGGQRQRVLLARAIAQDAKLLLLDEPFNGVDTTTQQILVDVLADLRANGAAVVMSTHDLAMAHVACSDACLLNRHQLAVGPVESVLTPSALQATYGHAAVVMAEGSSMLVTGT
ncbi:MAG: metal ABC transporter ATP-binding protein [Acidimicrobiia bacterium]